MQPVQNSNLTPLDSNIDNYWEKAERATKIALPFLALYAPVGQSLSVYTNCVNLVSHPTEIYEASKSLLSIAATLTSFTAGIYLFATLDLATSSKNTAAELYHGEYEKAASELAKTVGNALYLSLIVSGSSYVLIASLANQAALQLYAAHNEWEEGKSPEAIANLAMALIRVGQAGQVYSQLPPKPVEESEKCSFKKTPEQIVQEEQDYEEMKAILEGLDAYYNNPKGKDAAIIRALKTSVSQGKSGHLRAILEQAEQVDPSLLKTALQYGKTDISRMLIEHATTADGTLKDKWATHELLFLAIKRNDIEIVEMQLDRGMNIQSALFIAADVGTLKMVDVLLERGADIQEKDWLGRSALDLAMLKNKEKIIERLMGLGCAWDEILQMKNAISKRDLKRLQQLFEWGIKEETANCGLTSATAQAWCWNGAIEAIEMLIDYGVDVNKTSALSTAILREHVRIASLLLDAGADTTKPGNSIYRPAGSGNLELVQLLVEHGADPNHLSEAAAGGHKNVVEYLLGQGATPNSHAVSAAFDYGFYDIAKMIQQAGA